MKTLLDFIYSGETQVLQEELKSFMNLASTLEVNGLIADVYKTKLGTVVEPKLNQRPTKVDAKKRRNLESEEKKERENVKVENFNADDQNLENSEKIEQDFSDFSVISGSSESIDKNTFNISHTPLISLTEYDAKILALISKLENGWICLKCPYSARRKSHLQEHAEKHLEGISLSFECKSCHKIFSGKRSLRSHKYSCVESQHDLI